MSSDKERIHRWITQAELERMLADAYQRGAEAMREAAAKEIEAKVSNPYVNRRMAEEIRALPLPEDKR